MYYYQFHVGDYTSSTAHLSELEDLAYRRMLDWCYVHEKPLPEAVEDIARLIRMRSHSDCIASVLREFFERTQVGWVNRRALREIEAFKGKSEKARQSAKARWDANALRPQSEGNANQEPITNNQEPVTKNQEPSVEAPKRRRQQLPEGFTPNEAGISAAQKKGISVPQELEKFRNYHQAKGSVMLDWQAAWRTWVGNCRPTVTKGLDPEWAAFYSRSSSDVVDTTAKVIE